MSRILLGVTGGIAAYKAVPLLRHLQTAGHEVRVIMTQNAARLIAPLTFQALAHYPVYVDEFGGNADPLNHIMLAKWTELFVIAPATANTIGKLAAGIADNLLTSIFLATQAEVFVFPAMNVNMYLNASVQANIQTLKSRDIFVEEPGEGELACGDTAMGRLPEPDYIADVINRHINSGLPNNNDSRLSSNIDCGLSLSGVKILVTAGPTVEPIDPVRYISNRSSGRMGYTLAEAARSAGADVTLISGPVDIKSSIDNTIYVKSAADMLSAVQSTVPGCDIFVMAAAVADYTPAAASAQKIKKTETNLFIELVKTVDVLKVAASGKKRNQVFAGFAAESENLSENARKKLKDKNLDMIIANDISRSDIGFDSSDNEVIIYFAGGKSENISKRPKKEVAVQILKAASEILKRKTDNEKKR